MIDQLKNHFITHDRFAKELGFQLTELEEGEAKVVAEAKEEHLNAAGVVHGGFLFALADVRLPLPPMPAITFRLPSMPTSSTIRQVLPVSTSPGHRRSKTAEKSPAIR